MWLFYFVVVLDEIDLSGMISAIRWFYEICKVEMMAT